MEPEEIRQKLINSFSPYRCFAELWDYRNRIKFWVFDESNNPLITEEDVAISEIKTQSKIESLVQSYKEKIKD